MEERIVMLTIATDDLECFVKACHNESIKLKEVSAQLIDMSITKCYVRVKSDEDLFNLGAIFNNEIRKKRIIRD